MASKRKSPSHRKPKRKPVGPINPPNTSGLAACIEDFRLAALDGDTGPAEPNEFKSLRSRLENVRTKLPPLYIEAVVTPFIKTLDQLGATNFASVLRNDPNREGTGGLMMDIAQAILQHGEKFADAATDGFQEVATDLYDGFLSAEDRKGVEPPDLGVIPPLVKWGNPDFGPYTWPVDATDSFHVKAGIVNLPPANARKGLFAWPALGHETAGHDILHADTGLQDELARALQSNLTPLGHGLAAYWSERIDETSSDVMGILNMGPAAGIGLIVYFRALNAAYGGTAKLRNDGPDNDPHPADILRGYLAAETVALLLFADSKVWSDLIAKETDKDAGRITVAGEVITSKIARDSARIVADTLVQFKPDALEQHALGQIQNWRDADEQIVKTVREVLRTGTSLPASQPNKIYAAHVVAAAAIESLANGPGIVSVFDHMKTILKTLHDQNPAWGPLFVRHPGNVVRDVYYLKRG